MERGANHWFRFWKKKTKNPSWEELAEALIRRFGGRDRALVFETLVVVREKGEDLLRAMEIARVSSDVRFAERTTTRNNLYQSRFQGSGGVVSQVKAEEGDCGIYPTLNILSEGKKENVFNVDDHTVIFINNEEEEEPEEGEDKDQKQMEKINSNKYYEVTRMVARKKDQLVAELGLAWIKLFLIKLVWEMAIKRLLVGFVLEVKEGFYLFELGGVDLILGVTWLATLGERMVMLAALLKETEIEVVTLVWEMGSIFNTPQELPPKRHLNHQIPIKVGVDPINVRPSRYPYLLKAEIEKQVKKDGSWRFCIGYRTLNKATIPDKFLILVIEELLGELYGASYFSKIDLGVGKTWEEHKEHLFQVLSTLWQQQLFANWKRCEFGKKQIRYLGHVISSQGVEMDPEKVLAVQDWPIPRSIKALRGFLGLTGYYRRFTKDYGKIAKPFDKFIKKRVLCMVLSKHRSYESLEDNPDNNTRYWGFCIFVVDKFVLVRREIVLLDVIEHFLRRRHMEGRLNTLERLASEQGRAIVKLKEENRESFQEIKDMLRKLESDRAITERKDTMQEIREIFQEIKDMSWKPKSHERGSEGSQSYVNGERKGRRWDPEEEIEVEREENQKCWIKRGELSIIEGNGTQGHTTRAANVFEVQNITGTTEVHLTINSMEENLSRGSRPSNKNPRTFLWKILMAEIVDVASEKGAKVAALRDDNLTKVDGENTLGEDCDGNVVTLASYSEVAKHADFSGESVLGLGVYVKTMEEGEDRGKKAENGGNMVTTTSENKVEDAAVGSVHGSKVVGVEEAKDGGGSEEVEKDKDCSENTVTVGVPIAETSENTVVEVKDLRDEGYDFVVGDFGWGQAESKPWCCNKRTDLSDDALKLQQKNRSLVTYFGLEPMQTFWDNIDERVKQSSCIDFANVVQEAAGEIGRPLSMKLSCLVVDKRTSSESESTLLLRKTSRIKEGVVVPETGIDRFLYSQTEPPELLFHVDRIARVSDSGSSIIELEIFKARLSTYYLSKGHKLPDFMDIQLVPGIGNSLLDEIVAVENSKSTTVKESMEAESLTVSRKVKATQTSAVVAVLQYPPTNYQTEDGKKATSADGSAPTIAGVAAYNNYKLKNEASRATSNDSDPESSQSQESQPLTSR
ncbi:hypothetical protein V8G54_025349 [Vigna mungo]|uniref:Uncharacterized protein n=1 Tax=Vigna mungo TaxID=3915 RepID=A0AAQ3MWS3_VIGMU